MALGLSQYGSITGRRYTPNYVERINAQTPYLPQYIAAKERKELVEKELAMKEEQMQRTQAYREKQLKLTKSAQEAAKKREQQQMGLTAGKLGLNVAMNAEDATLGDIASNVSSSIGTGPEEAEAVSISNPALRNSIGVANKPQSNDSFMQTAKDIFGGLQVGDIISSGLVGFGASQLIDEDASDLKKIGIGAGAGALINLVGGLGDGGSSFYDAVVGGVFGGIGGGLGGLF